MRSLRKPASGTQSGNALMPAITAEPPGRTGARRSSHARLRTIFACALPTASQRESVTTGGSEAGASCMANGIILADGPAPLCRFADSLPLEIDGAHARRALSRRPARPHGEQPHVHHHDGARAALYG